MLSVDVDSTCGFIYTVGKHLHSFFLFAESYCISGILLMNVKRILAAAHQTSGGDLSDDSRSCA